MKKDHLFSFAIFAVLLLWMAPRTEACTNVLVSAGASADGSVMISYLADAAGFMDPLYYYPGGTHEPGDSIDIICWHYGHLLGRIPQVERTYRVIGNMNEHQVAIGETTFTGRSELHTPNGFIDYGAMMYIGLQRSRTAREAIEVMTGLVEEFGYNSTGESFSIADKNEAWILEFIGKGEHGQGAVWVAARVPDGYIAAHANQARIRQIDWNDTENWMWSDDLVSFAVEMGWFGADQPREEFSFVDVYNPLDCESLLLCEGRVWSIFRRAAPEQEFNPEYWRCVEGAEPYPLFVKPDKKISVQDMIGLVRDHFHDSPYYTAEGFSAGPFNNPYRWRPIYFELDGQKYAWPRTISQPQTGFSFVSQSRNWLPDPIGGIFWYGVDDTYSNAYMPIYVGSQKAPVSLTTGNVVDFDWDSAFWVFNLVANYAYGLYSYVIEDIKEVQQEVEKRSYTMTQAVDVAAQALYNTDREMMYEYLTDFSVNNAEYTVERWRELGYHIFSKYNDRYIRTKDALRPWPEAVGYPEEFLRQAVEERPGYYDVKWRKKGEESE
ncbi:MAG: dipeptidase [Bacteroidota bacterium]